MLSFIEKTKQLVSCNKRMDRAVSQLIEKCDTPGAEKSTGSTKGSGTVTSPTSPAANPIPALQKALKGVPKSLLEKVYTLNTFCDSIVRCKSNTSNVM